MKKKNIGPLLLQHVDSRQESGVPPVCLPVSCRVELWAFTASGTTTDNKRRGGRGGLPLRMTPPWPFSTSPHCASTEPCGDTHSLGQARWFEIASARFMRCWSAPHPTCRATETAGIKGASFHGGDACSVGIQGRFIHHNKPKPGLFGMELSNDSWAYFFFQNQHIAYISIKSCDITYNFIICT